MNLRSLLANRTFLYVVLAFSVASFFGYVVGNNTNAVLFFILTGFIASYFSKNMAVILLVPLVLTNFVFSANRIKEGLENQADGEDSEDADEEGDAAKKGKKDAAVPKKKKPTTSNSVNGAGATNANGGDGEDVVPNETPATGKKKADTFAALENIMNSGSLNQMANGMDGMVANHEKLQNMIETMSPLIDKAGKLLERVNSADMGNIGQMVEKMSGMIGGLGNFGGQANVGA